MTQFPPDFADAFLQLHNQYRETHNSPPLEIIDELSESAQEWADHLAVQGIPVYKSDPEYGENIFAGFLRGSPENIKPEDPLELWYRQGRYFKYGEETVKNIEDVRHFTQMLWKSTTSMGIGMAIGEDGETYIVCFYQPPGNVPEEFAENVLSPFQAGDAELLPHEAEEIKTIDISPKVVASMERLYAVPSEKLRVWSAWLTKIGDVTDEWQKWLRANIDLAIRIAGHLEEAEEALKKSRMEDGDKPDEVLSSQAKRDTASQSVEEESVEEESAEEDSADLEVEASLDRTEASEITVIAAASSREDKAAEEAKEADEEVSEDIVEKEPSATGTSKSEEPEEPVSVWPVGIPWKPSEEDEKEDEENVFEKLPIPSTEEEMKEYLKKFETDAVMYRSYYKHWRETADQTMSEIGGRYVMATFLVQGRREEALRRIAKRKPKQKAPKKPFKRKGKPSKTAVSDISSDGSEYVTAPTSMTSESPEAPETADNPEAPETADNPEESEQVETPEEPKASDSSSKPKSSASGVEDATSEKEVQRDEALDVDEKFRDCSRASEPIPYHFYLRAEPDVDLAGVEDEDDEILEIDLTRSDMIGTLKRVFYNLAEKPCKSGKPYI